MLYQDQNEFFNTDGSVNTERAIKAGKDARSRFFLDGLVWVARLFRAPVKIAGQAVPHS